MLSLNDIKAGKSKFTVSNGHGEHFTYKVTQKDEIWFVSVLTGTDNDSSYTYMGLLNKSNGFFLGKKSNFSKDCKAYKVFVWVLNIAKGIKQLPEGYEFVHAGCCLKCGRTLTTPESIKSGYGAVCLGKL